MWGHFYVTLPTHVQNIRNIYQLQANLRGVSETLSKKKPCCEVLFSSGIRAVERRDFHLPWWRYNLAQLRGAGSLPDSLSSPSEGKAKQRVPECSQGPHRGPNGSAKERAHYAILTVNAIFVPGREVVAKHGLVQRCTGADMQISVGKHSLRGFENHGMFSHQSLGKAGSYFPSKQHSRRQGQLRATPLPCTTNHFCLYPADHTATALLSNYSKPANMSGL